MFSTKIKDKKAKQPSKIAEILNLNRIPTPARIGVDIGSSAVKMVELKQNGKHIQLMGFASVPFPHNCIDAQGVHDVEAVAGTIRQCWEKMSTSTKNAVISIPPSNIVTKIFKMPGGLNPTQQMNEAEKEAEKQLPFPVADAVWDWVPLETPGVEPFGALLVAAMKDKLNERVGVVEAAGLTTSVVDIENLSTRELLMTAGAEVSPVQDQAFALIDVGHSVINFCVFKNNRPIFRRELNVSRVEMERDWQAAMRLDDTEFRMARKSKLPEWEESGLPLIKILAEDIARGLSGYHALSKDDEVMSIYLMGGGSALPNLVECVQEQTLKKVEKWDPFANIQVPPKWIDTINQDGALFAVAAGLALRKFDKSATVGE